MQLFESFTGTVSLHLNIPVDVKTFGGISLIAAELNQVESQLKISRLANLRAKFEKDRGYRLLAFEVHSPPQVSILADPAWLAVYISLIALGSSCLQLLGSYSSVKTEAKELARDLGYLKNLALQNAYGSAAAISSLSDAQRRELIIGVQLYIEQATNTAIKTEKIILRSSRFASILSRKNASPTLEVRVEPTFDN